MKTSARLARGRPTDYTPAIDEQAEKLARLGATDVEIADFFGKSESTISLWKTKHPTFSEALKRGKLASDLNVTESLFKRAQFHEYIEEQAIKVREVVYGESGKKISEIERVEVVEVKKVLPPSDVSMIFWLKNRRREQWRDKVDVEHGGKVIMSHEERVRRREEALKKKRDEPQPQQETGDGAGQTRH